jgi:hypothetical protein
MRIQELLENAAFKEDNFIKKSGEKEEIDYDLADDLVHFMHNDDHAYRRHVYPVIVKCIGLLKHKKPTQSKMFAEAIKECYKAYSKKFPIRVLPESLEEDQLKEACEKIHSELLKHVKDGKYKD